MKNSTTSKAFISALLLHLVVGVVLLFGMEFSLPKDKPKAVVINASMVSQKLFDDLVKKKADIVSAEKRKVEQKRKDTARIKREKQLKEKQRKEAQRKKVEAKRVKTEKAKAAQKKKDDKILFDKIVAAKALRAKKDAEKAKKIADDKRKKQDADRAKKQEAERVKKKKAEAKRIEAEKVAAAKALKTKQAKEAKALKAKRAKEAKAKAAKDAERLRQAELDKQMEAEFEDSFSSAQSSKQLSEIARYKALIQQKIGRYWQLEPSMKGKTCTLAIRLAPDGLVLSVNRSKGDQKLCDSAKRATLRAKTLPIPKDPEIAPQFRDFDITLEPDL